MSPAPPREDRLGLAILLCLGAFFSFTLVDTSAKWLAGAGLPVLQVVFIRYLGHFAASAAMFLPGRGLAVFRSNAPKVQLGRAFFLVAGTACNFAALSYLPLTVTTSIFFATPVLVSLLAVPILGERIGLRRFLAILVGFGGVLIITEPWGAAFHWAMLFSLAALFCASMYFVLTRMIAGVDDNPTGQMITSGIPAVALAPFVVSGWVWPPDAAAWLAAVAIGLLGVGGHTLITVGYRYAPAPTLAPAVYSQILYAATISWVIFSQPPDTRTLLGAGVIVGAGLYIWLRERALRKAPSLPLRAGR